MRKQNFKMATPFLIIGLIFVNFIFIKSGEVPWWNILLTNLITIGFISSFWFFEYKGINFSGTLYKKIGIGIGITSILLAFLIPFDFILPSYENDKITVTDKYIYDKDVHNFKATGHYKYNESVSSEAYDKINVNDVLEVELSPIFQELRSIYLVKGDSKEFLGKGGDLNSLAGMMLVFLLPLILFLPIEKIKWWYVKLVIFFVTTLASIIAVVIWARVILVWLGIIDKV